MAEKESYTYFEIPKRKRHRSNDIEETQFSQLSIAYEIQQEISPLSIDVEVHPKKVINFIRNKKYGSYARVINNL